MTYLESVSRPSYGPNDERIYVFANIIRILVTRRIANFYVRFPLSAYAKRANLFPRCTAGIAFRFQTGNTRTPHCRPSLYRGHGTRAYCVVSAVSSGYTQFRTTKAITGRLTRPIVFTIVTNRPKQYDARASKFRRGGRCRKRPVFPRRTLDPSSGLSLILS